MRSDILVGSTVYGVPETEAVNAVLKGGWLGIGKYADLFEKRVAKYVGHKYGIVTNSGSSALLLAVTALNLPKGSKVIVCAAGFPATVAPIIHAGLVPVFVDAEMISYSIDGIEIIKAIKKYPDVKAIVFAHTVGNVADMDLIMQTAKRHKLLVIEDICDALGAKWKGKQVGSFGDIACLSFYPSHHITAGGLGGMVLTSNKNIAKDVISLRDWGKMHKEPEYYNAYTTETKYFIKVDGINYDYRYSYSHIGYNLKPSDLNCAFGLAQMDRLSGFIKARNKNFDTLSTIFSKHSDFVVPIHYINATPSWFNYPVIVANDAPFTRDELVRYFESKKVRCRLFFAGNITRQPAFKGKGKKIGKLHTADFLMKNAFLIACHPALTDDDIKYIGECLDAFLSEKH